ncbi:MAG: glycosyltransferase family 39 protein [Anaerolineales bacterium]|nr:glycosyltransferase family 39 protein [Anaerolineales bacterium]
MTSKASNPANHPGKPGAWFYARLAGPLRQPADQAVLLVFNHIPHNARLQRLVQGWQILQSNRKADTKLSETPMNSETPAPTTLPPPQPSPVSTPAWRRLSWLLAIALAAIGLGIRLFDLTDPPTDFHPTRQLRGAIIARGIYYAHLPEADPKLRTLAINYASSTGQYEPPILETLTAYTYLILGEEKVWVARLYNSLFWVLAGLAVFDLARRMTTPGAALAALGYYLLLPFGGEASRSFQPDPGMTAWLILGVYALYRWSVERRWRWALLAGVLGGMAVLTKAVAVYFVAGAALSLVLYSLGLKRFWREPQVWVMATTMALPTALFLLFKRQGNVGDYLASWTVALSHLIVQPQFYARWLSFVQNLMGFAALLLALVGVLIARPREKALLLGLWGGYLVYGLTLPYQMYTHNYYHLMLIPILALSLAQCAQPVLERVAQQNRLWRMALAGVAVLAIFFPSWVTIITLASEDHRHEPEYWAKIGSLLPTDGKIVALTQDYGYPLMYYGWRKVSLWQTRGEQELADLRGWEKEFEGKFTNQTEGKDYFLVTSFRQFDEQADLKAYLYAAFPIFAEAKGYLIFDLAHPLVP